MTAKEMIDAAGRLLGELRADRSFGPDESDLLFVSLNNMLSNWAAGKWAIHQMSLDMLPATGAASYTIGPGGSLSVMRPVHIERVSTINSFSMRLPGRIVSAAEWSVMNRDDTATGDFVEMIWPDYGFPVCAIHVHPRVNPTSTIEIYSLKPLFALSLSVADVQLPHGYEEAIIYNFACKIAPEFNKQPSPEVMRIAETSRAAIAAMNAHLYPASVTAETMTAAPRIPG